MAKVRKLPIRKRRILKGDGDVTSERSVLCPQHGESVPVSVCGECVRCDSVTADAVTCRPEMAQPTMRWSPLLRRMLPAAADRVAISEVMSRDVRCVTGDVSVESVGALLRDCHFGAAPVVDKAGFPIGMVAKTDLLRERWADDDVVADIMMPVAFTLTEDEPLSRAAAVMATERVHHLPVVARDGRVVGILSTLDFARWIAGQSGYADLA